MNMKLRERSSPRKTERLSPIRFRSPSALSEPNGNNGKLHSSRFIAFKWSHTKLILMALCALVFLLSATRTTQRLHALVDSTSDKEYKPNPFALAPGELPGYTGWARPEQTLAGYFHLESSSHPTESAKYHFIVQSGDKFSFLITCTHDENSTYVCPPSGTLFYVRAFGPSVITANIVDHFNSSYSIELYPVDVGEYTLEVVVTFSAPLELHDFPLGWNTNVDDEDEPGYEGYLIQGFPISILVKDEKLTVQGGETHHNQAKQWCNFTELTEQSATSSLTAGHWQVIDHVGRLDHQPLTPDETFVSLDGYRMGLNSIGVRMQYEYEDCELMHIRDIVGNEQIGHVMGRCLHHLGYLDEQTISRDVSANRSIPIDFNGVNVIFIGDSVMKLEMGFFIKLLGGSGMVDGSRAVNVTFIETNGGIRSTLPNIISTLNSLEARDKSSHAASELPNKRVIIFNSGLHDIDILCSSKRKRTRNETALGSPVSCADAYQNTMKEFVEFMNTYPAEIKLFRTTTAGWPKVRPSNRVLKNLQDCSITTFLRFQYGNYGFQWPASEVQPQSRSTHMVHYFNQIAIETIKKYSKSIHVTDGYWITLPRPDHTQTSKQNQVGKHLVHPGYEVLSVLARKLIMLLLWGLCENVVIK